ncbi:AraC family transcriptional regulator [Sphingomonas sp. AR_OL41]|uniref:helix-turn-helix domain-containing protein n=1 Tax=Sphingomonas sp. AR_OL41 TaxID=3042729 RepID=UPI0024808F3B|nr:AraC family transcriptional regulator [Sphingomonas sp. AR_OL41]MDH7971596.1 AraC family transcriptional regulator [Sphingomonas sp. AR_OL41]
MNESEFDMMLTPMRVSVQRFLSLTLKRGHALTGNRGAGIEVYYVLVGTMCLEVACQPVILCGRDTLILLPPGLERTIRPASEVEPGAGTAEFGADQDLFIATGTIAARVSGTFGLLDSVARPIIEGLGDSPFIADSCRLMVAEFAGAEYGSRTLADALMKVCIVMALRRTLSRSEADRGLFGALRDPRLRKAIAAVIANPAAPHNVSSLAGVASMSRSAFAREFSATLAMTPMAFVARTRLQQGANLLSGTRLPVKMIAANIGFASRSHFSRAFAAAYGADPSSFRRAGLRQGRTGARRDVTALRHSLSQAGEC